MHRRIALAAGLTALIGCSSPEPTTNPSTATAPTATTPSAASAASAAPSAASSTAASSSSAATTTAPPVCTRSEAHVWATGVNSLTGLTTKKFGDAMGIGFAVGVEPRVLVVDGKGQARVLEVRTGGKAKAAPPPSEGTRVLMRVSPAAIDGEKARAFVDYRDEYRDKRRRVACGPAESDDDFLAFEGTSYLDLDPKPTGEEKKKLFSWKKLGGYVELRDCRTFVTLDSDEVWALGSVLRGIEKEDGSNEWKMVLLVDFGKNDDEIVLHETALREDPPKLFTFEIPTSRRVADRGYLVATRFAGSLMLGVLEPSRKLRDRMQAYPGFATMPDIGSTADDLVLVTGVGLGKSKSLKALRIPRDTLALPARYEDLKLPHAEPAGDAESAFSAPELSLDSTGRLWLTYIEGSPSHGVLRIAPLDKALAPAGRSFAVTEEGDSATEGRLVALGDGSFVVAYVRARDKTSELVTERLRCEVAP